MSMHLSHQEKIELAAALRLRYRNREINTKTFMEELAKLRMSHDEISEIASAALDERKLDNSRTDDGDALPRRDTDLGGRQFASPADREAYERSVAWLANYHRGNRDK